MKIGFKNFANAGSGTVRIGDLTVIFGPNNTGKTYVSYAVYSILRDFENLVKVNLSGKKVAQLVSEMKSKGKAQFELPDFARKLEKLKSSATPLLNLEISEHFQVAEEHFQKADFTVEIEELDLLNPQSDRISSSFGNITHLLYKFENKKCTFNLYSKENNLKNSNDDYEINEETINHFINKILYKSHFANIIPAPFPVTSERTGISLFYKIFDSRNSRILREIDDTMSNHQISKLASLSSRHALPIGDSINIVRFYESLIKKESSLKKGRYFADIIEILSILLGNGEFGSMNDSVYYKVGNSGKKNLTIPLHAASSSVKSLLMLDLFIKHVADNHSILMIDEPELNLCVANQVRMARLVARLVNSGIKVLITTHSDFFIREICNLITLNHANKKNKSKMMKEYDIRQCDLLKVSQVSAYRTDENGNFKEVEVFKSGIDTEFWNEQIQFENRKSEDIFFASGIG